jgi:uncharacterized protein
MQRLPQRGLWPDLGFGVGLRPEHYDDVLTRRYRVDWFEVITENYIDSHGRPRYVLERVRRDRPVALHGVALSIGSADPLRRDYLEKLRDLVNSIEPSLVTDHLCWTGVGGESLYDLLPLPYTEEALDHVVERVGIVQDHLGCRIALENPSTYVAFRQSTIPEWNFLAEVAERADCGILLDVNNVYVSSRNHGFDPLVYLGAIPPERVAQIHLAGFADMGSYLFDTHSCAVREEVWRLYRWTIERYGEVATLVEWDTEIPTFARLCQEAEQAREIAEQADEKRQRRGTIPARVPTLAGEDDSRARAA